MATFFFYLFFLLVILNIHFRFFSAYDLAFTTNQIKDPFNIYPLIHATSSEQDELPILNLSLMFTTATCPTNSFYI